MTTEKIPEALAVLQKMESDAYAWNYYQEGGGFAGRQREIADKAIAAFAELIDASINFKHVDTYEAEERLDAALAAMEESK